MTLDERIGEIISDREKSVDDRIDGIFILRKEQASDNKDENFANDIKFYTALISMIRDENAQSEHMLELMQLYVLLAETYVELKDYRPIERISDEVNDMVGHEEVSWEVMEQTLPRIIDAVGETVYNHALYKLLLYYIRGAYREGKLTDEYKGRMRKMLKLRVLLGEDYWLDTLFDKELRENVASFFTSFEMLKIMLKPDIGHLKKDPVEYTREWEEIYYDVEDYLEERFSSAPRHMGFCFLFWNAKKEYLRERYGIEWHTPSQMNPNVIFD